MLWTDRFVGEMSRVVDTPDELLEAAAYFVAGSALVGRGYAMFPDRVWTNLYVILVSPPGWYHKSTSLIQGLKILAGLDVLRVSGGGSTESLLRECAQIEEGGGMSAIMVLDEFSSFLRHIGKEYASGIQPFIAERFQGGVASETSRVSKSSEGGVSKCRVSEHFVLSFGATSTIAWLFDQVRRESIESGFFSRFLVVEAHEKTRSYEAPRRMEDKVLGGLQAELEEIRSAFSEEEPIEFGMTEAAFQMYRELYRHFEASVRDPEFGLLASFSSRLPVYTVKLAMIRAMLRLSRGVINESDVDGAAKITTGVFESFKRVIRYGLNDTWFSRMLAKIEAYLETRNGVCSVRDLYRHLKCKKSELKEALDFMANTARIQKITQPSEGARGRPGEVIRLVAPAERAIIVGEDEIHEESFAE